MHGYFTIYNYNGQGNYKLLQKDSVFIIVLRTHSDLGKIMDNVRKINIVDFQNPELY